MTLLSPTAALAKIDIEIIGVTEPIEKNIRAFLSVTHYAGRDDLTPEVIARLERRIPAETRSALQPLGYYTPTVSHSTTRAGDDWKIVIQAEAGRGVRISEVDIQIQGDGKADEALVAILARQELKPGGRLDHGAYERVKAELVRVATSQGYLDAKLTRHEMTIDPLERRAVVALAMQTGARYRFGTIDFFQDTLREDKARRLLRMRSGDPYTLDALLESQYILDDSQYFANVEVEVGEADSEQLSVPLTIRADRNKRNGYAVSAGFGTDTRARGKVTWDNRYLNKRGHRSQVEVLGSAIVQQATAKYIVPVMDIALEKLEFSVTGKKEELGDVVSRRTDFGLGLTQALGSWQRVTFVRFSNESNEKLVNDGIPLDVPAQTFLILPGISFSTLPSRFLERQPRRYSLFAELTGSPQSLGSDATFLQLRLQAERVFDLAPRWHLRLRGQAGITWSEDFSTLPVSHRFFAGGDNSVRGFGLNELSPVNDVTGARVGGRHLFVASVEVERDLPKDFGVAVFTDAGHAFDNFGDPLEYSAGIGGRYRIAGVASLGIDVAQALSDTHRSPRFHLRLTTLF
ncbi:MAG: BamA/TamA family outer membrane protein [Candidatus Obscuribacterales bacterium]|nr:BamA/TamA family outer membrane protein [Steroidobacteraceae bacterium]